MKEHKTLVIFILITALIIGSVVLISRFKEQKTIKQYAMLLSDTEYSGLDSNATAQHGTAYFYYTLFLHRDGSATLRFKYSKTNDHSTFSTNKTETFDMENLTWVVEKDGKSYRVRIQGTMDWRGYTAARLDRVFEIRDFRDDGEITLWATREKYHTVLFEKETD